MKNRYNFNFVIGRPLEANKKGSIGLMSSQVHYGTLEEATKLCNEISKIERKKYGIFQLIDVKELQVLQDDLKLANETIKIQHRLMKNAEERGMAKAMQDIVDEQKNARFFKKTQDFLEPLNFNGDK